MKDGARWRSEIDALVFPVDEFAAFCAVHRRAFGTLLGSEPTPDDCLGYFGSFEYVFRAAASEKIAKKGLPAGRNFHLTSRDIARKLVEFESTYKGELMMAHSQATHLPVAAGQVSRLTQALMAMALGLFIVGFVGFSHIDVVHNAAHDVRHSNAFPCH